MIDTDGRERAGDDLSAERRKVSNIQLCMLAFLVAVLAAIGFLIHFSNGRNLDSAPAVAVTGQSQHRTLPPVTLRSESGASTSLAAYRGKVVVLAPVDTTCTGTCPFTVSALQAASQDVKQAGMSGKVAFVGVTLDPARDTPARLRAFAHLTGITWPLLTGSPSEVARLWRFLGISARHVTPSTVTRDWQTGAPVPYTLAHNDAVYFLGPKGQLRIVTVGPGKAKIGAQIQHMINLEGIPHPAAPHHSWTVGQAIGNVEVLSGKRIALEG